MKIGIIGAGQLAQMLAHAAEPLDISCHCLANSLHDPAAQVANLHSIDLQDTEALTAFANSVDIITFENENVDPALLKLLQQHATCYPNWQAIQTSQDRLIEKQYLSDLNIPVAPFAAVNSLTELQQATQSLQYPCVLKTRRFGYDGKGQVCIQSAADIDTAWEQLKQQPLILEAWIPFEREVSIIGVRSASGDIKYYPLTENIHQAGILRQSNAPFINESLQQQAQHYCQQVLNQMDFVGVLTIEFFVHDGQLIANEIAPRVHNSGHWTIEGAVTSQFENHIRAILNLPLGNTAAIAATTMFNCIGELPDLTTILELPDAHFHSYHKTARPKRKLAHVTLVKQDKETTERQYQQLQRLLT